MNKSKMSYITYEFTEKEVIEKLGLDCNEITGFTWGERLSNGEVTLKVNFKIKEDLPT